MEIIKHLDIFDPGRVGPTLVIGVGAVGCAVALQLAKLGLNFTIADDDYIAEHNVANQVLFGTEDVGKSKVKTVSDRLRMLTGANITALHERISEKNQLRGYAVIFVCVDSMAQRMSLFKQTLGLQVHTYVEGRMGAREGATYLFNPSDIFERKLYSDTLYSDDDVAVDTGKCGVTPSVVSTAALTASYMVWLFISQTMNGPSTSHNEVLFRTSPPSLTSRSFYRPEM